MPTNVTGLGVAKIIPGSSAPLTMEQKNNLPKGQESHPLSTKAPATKKSSFGGVVTPVNTPISCSAILDCMPHENKVGWASWSTHLLCQYGERIVICCVVEISKGILYFDSSFIPKWLEKDGKVPKKVITRGYSNICEG